VEVLKMMRHEDTAAHDRNTTWKGTNTTSDERRPHGGLPGGTRPDGSGGTWERTPTPTLNNMPIRAGDFSTLTDALDYAALGITGLNFYAGQGRLETALPYSALREDALGIARRLRGLDLQRGDRLALIAETGPDFVRLFFACQYAGVVPVPLPVSINLGNRRAYVEFVRRLLSTSGARAAMASEGALGLLREAAQATEVRFLGTAADYAALPDPGFEPAPPAASDLAYLQFTSGSTRFPKGVMITQTQALSNLAGIIRHGVRVRPGDRCVSWLPFYHDMGLVGLVLAPTAAQLSVDYLDTRNFAMRPRIWLELMSQRKATISFGPPFGYEMVARRLRPGDPEKFDLRRWRVAGVGAEMIRPASLTVFADALRDSGFSDKAFVACYGMAECSLAVSFAPLGRGIEVDRVDGDHQGTQRQAVPVTPAITGKAARVTTHVNCGVALPGYEVKIRDATGRALPERHAGTLFVRGDSVMSGYIDDPVATCQALSPDGWLNTGDIGYCAGGNLYITGREKDLIIIKGRNIWPQDMESIAEQQPEVRTGDALAFPAPGPQGEDIPVLVVQSRESNRKKRADLVQRLQYRIREELGIDCFVELVPPHTLPRTSSGKLSRSRARLNFIDESPGADLVMPD
jgi:fatty-acyl-CoA synthase